MAPIFGTFRSWGYPISPAGKVPVERQSGVVDSPGSAIWRRARMVDFCSAKWAWHFAGMLEVGHF